jgi:glycosyltransferase involved in cell wall biosynthesis
VLFSCTGVRLAIVIPWSDRPELATTLSRNAPSFAEVEAEVVVVNCGGDRAALDRMLRTAPSKVVRVHVPARRFNKPLALNAGVLCSRAPRLLFLDSDIVFAPGSLGRAASRVDERTFVTLDRIRESQPPAAMELPELREVSHWVHLVCGGKRIRLETNRVRPAEGSRSAPGIVFLERRHLLGVGGMNAELEGWGWEDLDLLARLQLGLGLRHLRSGTGIHLTHDRGSTAGGQGARSTEQGNFARCLVNYGLGNLQGTYRENARALRGRLRLRPFGGE